MAAGDFAPTVCPFCHKSFELPNPYKLSLHYAASCGCGAMFSLEDEGDTHDTWSELEEMGVTEFEVVDRIDALSDGPGFPPDTTVVALFWRPSA